jgi:hypothetical protein
MPSRSRRDHAEPERLHPQRFGRNAASVIGSFSASVMFVMTLVEQKMQHTMQGPLHLFSFLKSLRPARSDDHLTAIVFEGAEFDPVPRLLNAETRKTSFFPVVRPVMV